MRVPHFNIRKAAQVAAFFALQEGGRINVLKLTKLIYLSDRKHMEEYDTPILLDKLVSMDFGPVNSMTLNLINGAYEEVYEWDEFILSRQGNTIAAAEHVTADLFDELSVAELSILENIWDQFKNYDRFELAQYTHEICREWEDPKGSSIPIEYETVFRLLNKDNSCDLATGVEELKQLRQV